MVYSRQRSTIRGWLCRRCIGRYFWEYTPTTLLLGWWGVISFFETLYILPANVIEYISSWRLPRG